MSKTILPTAPEPFAVRPPSSGIVVSIVIIPGWIRDGGPEHDEMPSGLGVAQSGRWLDVSDRRYSMPNYLPKALLRGLVGVTCSAASLPASSIPTWAQAPAPVRITVITDLADDIYNARSGAGGVDATRMAVADFGGRVLGRPIVVDSRNDHKMPNETPALAEDA